MAVVVAGVCAPSPVYTLQVVAVPVARVAEVPASATETAGLRRITVAGAAREAL
jgi:hypothetical protein